METKAVYVFLCKFVLSSKHLIKKKKQKPISEVICSSKCVSEKDVDNVSGH